MFHGTYFFSFNRTVPSEALFADLNLHGLGPNLVVNVAFLDVVCLTFLNLKLEKCGFY